MPRLLYILMSDFLKEITKRAAAESGIRQGLMELESWEASAHLQLQESKDSRNVGIVLVEEYGSLLARAGEWLINENN